MKQFFIASVLISALIAVVFAGGDPFAICDLPKDVGYSCSNGSPATLFYYDGISGFCEVLEYKGCGGNGNQFSDMTYCETFCIVQGDARPSPL